MDARAATIVSTFETSLLLYYDRSYNKVVFNVNAFRLLFIDFCEQMS